MACRAEPVRTCVIRTCVGCRSRAPSSELLRIVMEGGELLPDARRQMRGRGAHVHPDLACLDLAERRKAFPRALRVSGPLGSKQVRMYLERSGQWQAIPARDRSAAVAPDPGETG